MEPPWVPPAYRYVVFTGNTSVAGSALVIENRTLRADPPVHDSPPTGERSRIEVVGIPLSVVKSCVSWQFASGFPGSLLSAAVHPKPHT